jgi:hypothetical protein
MVHESFQIEKHRRKSRQAKRSWLVTGFGIDFVAVGILGVWFGAPLIAFHDIWFLATGTPPAMFPYDKALTYLAAAVAAVFSCVNLFVFRPGLPKYVTVILAILFGSYVVQPLLPVRTYPGIAAICICRIVGFCTLLLLVRASVIHLRAGKTARNEG